MTLAIETNGLTRCFGDLRAVDGLDLRVEAGKFYGFLGPNGAGKSTTIKMLTGLLAPTSGSMRILGEDTSDAEKARQTKRRVGVVPEELALFDNLTGSEYLTFIGRMYQMPIATVRERCRELLAMMSLDNEEKKLTLEYSHGMKKKLTLAAALIPNPDLLFLDEPFEGIDAIASRTNGLVKRVTSNLNGLHVAMSGGVARNVAMVETLNERLELKVNVSEDSHYMGALGAALFAMDHIQASRVPAAGGGR